MSSLINGLSIPNIQPMVYEKLLRCLYKEVKAYKNNIRGVKFILCPFRTFSRLDYLKAHLKYHCSKNMFLADVRSPQRLVVRAYFDYCQAIETIMRRDDDYLDLLQYSASIIKKWNIDCSKQTMSLICKQKRPVLVKVLTNTGPQY